MLEQLSKWLYIYMTALNGRSTLKCDLKVCSESSRGLFCKALVLLLLGGAESVQPFKRPRFELVCCHVVPTAVRDFATVITYFQVLNSWVILFEGVVKRGLLRC
jgi:hypothetical protein